MVLMPLGKFFDYKNQLIGDLLTDEKILRLLSDDGEIPENPEGLVYTQVFPYEYIPDTVEHGQTFICCDVDISKSLSKTFLVPTLHVWVFTHKSKLKLPGKNGVRTDKLCEEISRVVIGSRNYGLGELELDGVRRFAPVSDYQGKMLTFDMIEFNRLRPTGQGIPDNRKRG